MTRAPHLLSGTCRHERVARVLLCRGAMNRMTAMVACLVVLSGCVTSRHTPPPYVSSLRTDPMPVNDQALFPDYRTFQVNDVLMVRVEQQTGIEKLIARVMYVLPNGNLLIQGHDPAQRLFVSGLVRPMDIAQDNSVRSSYVVNVEAGLTAAR